MSQAADIAPADRWPGGNALLDRVPAADRGRLAAMLEPVTLAAGEVLFEPGDRLTHVYFLTAGMVSLLAVMHDGRTAETVTIGREGGIGLSAAGCVDPVFSRYLVQVPATGLRVAAARFEDMLRASATFATAVSRYREVLFRTTLQIVACNALHDVRQRFARWILTTHDRSRSDRLPLTQAAIAELLGVQRNRVSFVARDLQRLGLIDYRRGRIEVLDRGSLNFVACECYSVMAGELARLNEDPDGRSAGRPGLALC